MPWNPQRGGRGLRGGRNTCARGGFRADRKRGRTRCRDSGPGAAMEAALTDMYDQALLGILQHVGNVEEFLRILFGFLYRKTDFYRLLLRPGDRLGFPPGAAQAMALQAFRVFERMARQDDEKRRRELEAKLRKKEEEEEAAAAAERVKLCPAAQEIEVETTEHIPAPDAGGAAGTQESAAAQGAAAPSPVSMEPSGAAAPAELPTRQEQFQTNPDSYNGAVRENYTWSQDYSDLEIKVPVPKHIVKGKQVSVDISSGAIRVAVLEGSSQHVLMEGKLTHKINTESSLWSLEPGKCVSQPEDSPHHHSQTTLPSRSCSMEFSQLEPSLTPACFSSHPLAHPCAWQQNPAGIVLQWSALPTWGGDLSLPPAQDYVPGSCPCLWRATLYPGPGCHPCALPSPSHPLAC
ncbi:nudC domain-containing protein 3 isoform X1 [Corvus hawaiiensis]|uniref:nudC domain-containing protein 3 isoform X1 n=1 Tax=Corvus hawaiiensis TaxID=134902 RepID=UPI0020195032|nr:nudC domain-containing protein 3 isoform X1 [Corvus hawaiiensis]